MKKKWRFTAPFAVLFFLNISLCLGGSLTHQHSPAPEKVRYFDPVFENIEIRKDVVFGTSVNENGESENLKLDIYTPAGDEMINRPVIVWFHGGGFTFGNDKSQKYITEMASRFARKGYVCLSVDYRLRKNPREDMKGTISDAVEDALKGLAWIRENSASLQVDLSKIFAGGGSAGGILGSNLCFNSRPGNLYDKAGIIGFVNLWGSPGKNWGEISVDSHSPPTIIVHGTNDQLVDYQNSVELAAKLTAAGVKNELVTIDGAGHTPFGHIDEFEKNITRFLFGILNN